MKSHYWGKKRERRSIRKKGDINGLLAGNYRGSAQSGGERVDIAAGVRRCLALPKDKNFPLCMSCQDSPGCLYDVCELCSQVQGLWTEDVVPEVTSAAEWSANTFKQHGCQLFCLLF